MRSLGFLLVMLLALPARAGEAPLRLIQTIPLPDGRGRIDHMDLDAARQRLFVAELGNDTVAVIDLEAGKLVDRITGVAEPQGVAFVPGPDRLFVTSGETGSVAIFDGATLAPMQEDALASDADNIRYDPAEREIYVGFGNGGLGRLAAISGAHIDDIALAGHPESFQLETGGPLIFVNVPDAGDIEVVDRARRSTVASWPLVGVAANFPMALDEPGQRLIVATWQPAALLVLDTRTGKELARTRSCSDADDVWYDPLRRQLYVSCGQGVLDVVSLAEAAPRRIARIATAEGARTSLFVPQQDRLYVAVPHRGTQPAEILVYLPAS
jgi:DNA-binding beta-propeller fold protein YncE